MQKCVWILSFDLVWFEILPVNSNIIYNWFLTNYNKIFILYIYGQVFVDKMRYFSKNVIYERNSSSLVRKRKNYKICRIIGKIKV